MSNLELLLKDVEHELLNEECVQHYFYYKDIIKKDDELKNLDEEMRFHQKEMCKHKDNEEVYKKFAKKCANVISDYGKIPMIWGDVLVRHNASLSDMPSDMIYLDWGYDANYPFDLHLKKLTHQWL